MKRRTRRVRASLPAKHAAARAVLTGCAGYWGFGMADACGTSRQHRSNARQHRSSARWPRLRRQRRTSVFAGVIVLMALLPSCKPGPPPPPPLPTNAGAWHGRVDLTWQHSVTMSDGVSVSHDVSAHYVAPTNGGTGGDGSFTGSWNETWTYPPPADLSGCYPVSTTTVVSGAGPAFVGAEPGEALQLPDGTIDPNTMWFAEAVPSAPDQGHIGGTTTSVDSCGTTETQDAPCVTGSGCWFGTLSPSGDPQAAFNPNATELVGSGPACPINFAYVGCATVSWRLSRVPDADGDGVSDQQEITQGTDPFYPQGASVVEAYAPEVYLYSAERYMPTDTSNFLSRSALQWTEGGTCGTDNNATVGEGSVVAATLGSGGYAHTARQSSTSGNCTQNPGDVRASNSLTRPFQTGNGLAYGEGFSLDVNNNAYPGRGTTAPVYYQYKSHHYISYWFFYAYDHFQFSLWKIGSVTYGDHEGDWEHVAVHLDSNDRPTGIAYYFHNAPAAELPWPGPNASSPVTLDAGSHPVAFSANGTHASYATPGPHDLPNILGDIGFVWDLTDYGHRWDTKDNLINLESQPWWRYQGAWGTATPDPSNSGPLGPNPQGSKEMAPAGW